MEQAHIVGLLVLQPLIGMKFESPTASVPGFYFDYPVIFAKILFVDFSSAFNIINLDIP